MSWRSDSAQLIPGSWISSAYPGLGVPGAVIRASTAEGENGAGALFGDLDGAGDDSKEFRFQITRWPLAGTLTTEEPGVLTYSGGPDYAQANVWVDGVLLGTKTIGFFTLAGAITGLGGIESAEQVGAPSISAATVLNALIGLGGIDSEEQVGAPSVSMAAVLVSIAGIGAIDSDEQVGSVTLVLATPDPVSLAGMGAIDSAEAVGAPALSIQMVAVNLVGLGGIASSEGVGNPLVIAATAGPADGGALTPAEWRTLYRRVEEIHSRLSLSQGDALVVLSGGQLRTL